MLSHKGSIKTSAEDSDTSKLKLRFYFEGLFLIYGIFVEEEVCRDLCKQLLVCLEETARQAIPRNVEGCDLAGYLLKESVAKFLDQASELNGHFNQANLPLVVKLIAFAIFESDKVFVITRAKVGLTFVAADAIEETLGFGFFKRQGAVAFEKIKLLASFTLESTVFTSAQLTAGQEYQFKRIAFETCLMGSKTDFESINKQSGGSEQFRALIADRVKLLVKIVLNRSDEAAPVDFGVIQSVEAECWLFLSKLSTTIADQFGNQARVPDGEGGHYAMICPLMLKCSALANYFLGYLRENAEKIRPPELGLLVSVEWMIETAWNLSTYCHSQFEQPRQRLERSLRNCEKQIYAVRAMSSTGNDEIFEGVTAAQYEKLCYLSLHDPKSPKADIGLVVEENVKHLIKYFRGYFQQFAGVNAAESCHKLATKFVELFLESLSNATIISGMTMDACHGNIRLLKSKVIYSVEDVAEQLGASPLLKPVLLEFKQDSAIMFGALKELVRFELSRVFEFSGAALDQKMYPSSKIEKSFGYRLALCLEDFSSFFESLRQKIHLDFSDFSKLGPLKLAFKPEFERIMTGILLENCLCFPRDALQVSSKSKVELRLRCSTILAAIQDYFEAGNMEDKVPEMLKIVLLYSTKLQKQMGSQLVYFDKFGKQPWFYIMAQPFIGYMKFILKFLHSKPVWRSFLLSQSEMVLNIKKYCEYALHLSSHFSNQRLSVVIELKAFYKELMSELRQASDDAASSALTLAVAAQVNDAAFQELTLAANAYLDVDDAASQASTQIPQTPLGASPLDSLEPSPESSRPSSPPLSPVSEFELALNDSPVFQVAPVFALNPYLVMLQLFDPNPKVFFKALIPLLFNKQSLNPAVIDLVLSEPQLIAWVAAEVFKNATNALVDALMSLLGSRHAVLKGSLLHYCIEEKLSFRYFKAILTSLSLTDLQQLDISILVSRTANRLDNKYLLHFIKVLPVESFSGRFLRQVNVAGLSTVAAVLLILVSEQLLDRFTFLMSGMTDEDRFTVYRQVIDEKSNLTKLQFFDWVAEIFGGDLGVLMQQLLEKGRARTAFQLLMKQPTEPLYESLASELEAIILLSWGSSVDIQTRSELLKFKLKALTSNDLTTSWGNKFHSLLAIAERIFVASLVTVDDCENSLGDDASQFVKFTSLLELYSGERRLLIRLAELLRRLGVEAPLVLHGSRLLYSIMGCAKLSKDVDIVVPIDYMDYKKVIDAVQSICAENGFVIVAGVRNHEVECWHLRLNSNSAVAFDLTFSFAGLAGLYNQSFTSTFCLAAWRASGDSCVDVLMPKVVLPHFVRGRLAVHASLDDNAEKLHPDFFGLSKSPVSLYYILYRQFICTGFNINPVQLDALKIHFKENPLYLVAVISSWLQFKVLNNSLNDIFGLLRGLKLLPVDNEVAGNLSAFMFYLQNRDDIAPEVKVILVNAFMLASFCTQKASAASECEATTFQISREVIEGCELRDVCGDFQRSFVRYFLRRFSGCDGLVQFRFHGPLFNFGDEGSRQMMTWFDGLLDPDRRVQVVEALLKFISAEVGRFEVSSAGSHFIGLWTNPLKHVLKFRPVLTNNLTQV